MKQTSLFTSIDMGEIVSTSNSTAIDVEAAESLGIVGILDVDTPAAATFDDGTNEVDRLTFEAKAATDAGDYIVITDTSGLNWAAAANVSGTDPEPTGAAWVAIPAGRRVQANISADTTAAEVAARFETALNSLTGFTAVVTTNDTAADGTMLLTHVVRAPVTNPVPHNTGDTGPGGIAVAEITPGVVSEVDIAADTASIPTHGFTTGLKGQLTTTGTLPAGLSLATDYFIIVVSSSLVKFATSLVNAEAGTAVNITDQGSSAGVATFTPTTLAGGTYGLQVSNDNITWASRGSTTAITADANVAIDYDHPAYKYARVQFVLTAGRLHPVLQARVKI